MKNSIMLTWQVIWSFITGCLSYCSLDAEFRGQVRGVSEENICKDLKDSKLKF
jgi:hypothetical protein